MNKKEQSRQTFDLQASKYDTTFYGKHARKIYPYLLNEIIRCYGEEVLDQTTPNMIQRISGIFERNALISKEI